MVAVIPYENNRRRLSSDVDWSTIKVGDRLTSAIGTPGHVVDIDAAYKSGREDGRIEIAWDNGKSSHAPRLLSGAPWLDAVTYLGPVES